LAHYCHESAYWADKNACPAPIRRHGAWTAQRLSNVGIVAQPATRDAGFRILAKIKIHGGMANGHCKIL
jgi:hypothetical protein